MIAVNFSAPVALPAAKDTSAWVTASTDITPMISAVIGTVQRSKERIA